MKKAILTLASVFLIGTATARNSKPLVAVLDFKNETSAPWWQNGVGRELSDMLSNELLGTEAFRLVERNKLESIMDEQDLGASGRVSKSTAAKMGRLSGAQYLVTGSVASFEASGSKGGGFSFKGVSLGGKSKKVSLGIDIRVINSTTGEVEYARTIEGTSKSGGMSVGLYRSGFGGSLGGEKKTPTGKAIRAALIEATDYLACVMVYQDGCEADYRAKDKRRRKKSRSALSLD